MLLSVYGTTRNRREKGYSTAIVSENEHWATLASLPRPKGRNKASQENRRKMSVALPG
jgi:hypothetical protein